MSDKKLTSESLAKALQALEQLGAADKVEKGHASRGTTATAVETKVGVVPGNHVLNAQPNTPPGWAGTSVDSVSEEDGVAENGTDYVGGGGMAKSILELVAAGRLSADDASVLLAKGAFGKPDAKGKDKDKGGDEDDGDEDDDKGYEFSKGKDKKGKKVSKSFKEHLSPEVAETLEVSDVLAGFADAMQKSMTDLREELVEAVRAGSQLAVSRQDKFNKSLAAAISDLSEGFVAQAQRVEELETAPVRAPKSAIAKSVQPGEAADSLTRQEVMGTLLEMVHKGLAYDTEVIAFECSGDISDETLARVKSFRTQK